MAFVTRSKRETEVAVEQFSTMPLVGPGAYCSIESYSTDHGYAPFNSTAERGLSNNEDRFDSKPGPGYYSGEVDSPLVQKKKASSNAFVSRVSRFNLDGKEKTTSTPGPGTYVESNKWLKNSHHQERQPSSRNILFQRLPAAPSIPARNQSYGYEVGNEGDMQQQGPPGGQYTGHKFDSVGPGDYEPTFTLLRTERQTDFSRSKANRDIFKPKQTPAPGQYHDGDEDKDGGDNAKKGGKASQGASSSSNFASRVPRMPGEKAENQTPGPGSYHSYKNFVNAGAAKETNNFGSTAKRSYEVDSAAQLAAPSSLTTPGPGAYELRRPDPAMNQSLIEPAPFASTSLRFAGRGSLIPGPGTYYSEAGESFVAEMGKKIVGRNGIFGSSTQRFASTKSSTSYLYMGNDESPGPGTYGAEIALKLLKPQSRATSSFASSVSRFKPTKQIKKKSGNLSAPPEDVTGPGSGSVSTHGSRKQQGDYAEARHANAPPPGTYSTDDPWKAYSKKARGQNRGKAFISKASRFPQHGDKSLGRTMGPGPGSYDTAGEMMGNVSYGGENKCFVSSAPRFSRVSTLAPGPGAYDGEDPDRTMVRRSFNVTIDGVESTCN
mmetsp:Transcript_3003/g.7317  ORF Transcript_3003/g.7317 Transcript_3003/m.7317 type:complete len:605 (+) Transcript_3003:499-2313(+)